MPVEDNPTGLIITPTYLAFGPGEKVNYFRLEALEETVGYEGQLYLYKRGEDSDSYEFE